MRRTISDRLRMWAAAQVARGEHLRRERNLNAAFLKVEADTRSLREVAERQGWDLNLLVRKREE